MVIVQQHKIFIFIGNFVPHNAHSRHFYSTIKRKITIWFDKSNTWILLIVSNTSIYENYNMIGKWHIIIRNVQKNKVYGENNKLDREFLCLFCLFFCNWLFVFVLCFCYGFFVLLVSVVHGVYCFAKKVLLSEQMWLGSCCVMLKKSFAATGLSYCLKIVLVTWKKL